MLLSILAFLFSIIPSVLIFVLLRRRHKDDTVYKKKCNSALFRGLISVFPIIGISGILFILNNVLKLTLFQNINVLVYKAIYTFIVLALSEEIVKYFAFRLLLKKRDYAYSWADIVAVMVIIGCAFGLIEDLPYAIGSDPITMMVRGFTMGHVGYGFIMGWFYGKRLDTGKKLYGVIAFVLPWLLHGIYDFSLSPELIELNEGFIAVALFMALLDIILLVLMIRFFIHSKKLDRYQRVVMPLHQPASDL